MTATITPTRKDRHPSAPPVVPMVLLAVALLLGVSTLARSPARSIVKAPATVLTLPATSAPASTTSTTPTTSTTVPPAPVVAPAAVPTTVPPPRPPRPR